MTPLAPWYPVTAAVLVAACTLAEPREGSEAQAAGGNAIRTSVAVSPARAVLGQPVAITVRAANVSDRPLALDFVGPCILYFEVLDGTGHVVAPASPQCPLISIAPVLLPGQALEFTFSWAAGDRVSEPPGFLAPGQYHVRGVLDAAEPVMSEPVTIQLVHDGA